MIEVNKLAALLVMAMVPIACAGSSAPELEGQAPVLEEAAGEAPAAEPFEPPEGPLRPLRPTVPGVRPGPRAGGPTTDAPQATTDVDGVVHLTFVSHNEEPGLSKPDWTADRDLYLQNRELMEDLARLISNNGAAYNFQSDWNYLQAVEMFDTPELVSTTGGKNILRWMAEDMSVEIDPHAHETSYNYADVAFLIESLGVPPSETVGGFLYSPPDNPQGWEQHRDGISGWIYPEYYWNAELLWGAATLLHLGEDDEFSGIWRPAGPEAFYEDDPSGKLVYIGGCTSDIEGANALIKALNSGAASPDGYYTAAIMIPQDQLTSDDLLEIETFVLSLEDEVERGRVRWATLSEIARVWRDQYGQTPFQFDCSGL